MTTKKKAFSASLIKYMDKSMSEPIWFWVNTATGSALSPHFETQSEAEKWYDDLIEIHNQTYDLLTRCMKGKFYNLKGRIDVGDLFSSVKTDSCPFDLHLEDDILSIKVLALNVTDARKRASEYFEILEWIE